MKNIAPIQTRYKGYHFRSRLEARWAVFFDALGIEWQYEPEGYDLGAHGYYLPDFYLPEIHGGLWVEIKPQEPSEDEQKKLEALARFTGKSATFRVGEPMNNVELARGYGEGDTDFAFAWLAGEDAENMGWDLPYLFCICPTCGKVGFEYDGRGARVCNHNQGDKSYSGDDDRILDAAYAARSARFEHGKSGRT